jgi:hypothetical protein
MSPTPRRTKTSLCVLPPPVDRVLIRSCASLRFWKTALVCFWVAGWEATQPATKHWALKPSFLHACKHRPQRRDAQRPTPAAAQPRLLAVTLVHCIAFVLCSALRGCTPNCSAATGALANSTARCRAFSSHSSPRRILVLHLLNTANALSDCRLRSSWKTLPQNGF